MKKALTGKFWIWILAEVRCMVANFVISYKLHWRSVSLKHGGTDGKPKLTVSSILSVCNADGTSVKHRQSANGQTFDCC